MDQKDLLRSAWRRLIEIVDEVSQRISRLQVGFKTRLLADVRTFVGEVVAFRRDYLANGPMAPGISPQDAIDRLRRYHEVCIRAHGA